MRLSTPLCSLLGIDHPIVQAPIGSATTPALAAAVSNAGALGQLSVTWRDLDDVRRVIRETRALTDRPFGVNLVLAWPMAERVQLCLDEGVRIFSFFWGDPAEHVARVRDQGALVMQTVGSAEEARAAAACGVDVVVAQGWEAGGHVWGEVGTLALVPCVVDAVAPIPVVAAGGIGDGRGIAAALVLGAAGAWLGTRFVATEEAAAHHDYKARLVAADEDGTRHTTLFDGGWPNAPHRVLHNRTLAHWEAAGCPASPHRPGEGERVARMGEIDVERYSEWLPRPETVGDVGAMALYAGQSAGLVRDILPAGALVERLVRETEEALRRTC